MRDLDSSNDSQEYEHIYDSDKYGLETTPDDGTVPSDSSILNVSGFERYLDDFLGMGGSVHVHNGNLFLGEDINAVEQGTEGGRDSVCDYIVTRCCATEH